MQLVIKKAAKHLAAWWTMTVRRDGLVFFLRWLASPLQVGAAAPSSQFLARAIADQVDLRSAKPIIELGGGTGSVTSALLATGIDPGRLIVIERDARLCDLLRKRFPALKIVQGDATRLIDLLAPLGVDSASSVISSLPLRSLSRSKTEQIVCQSFLLLGKRDKFIQYTYGLRSPLADFNLYGKLTARIWLNFPPAFVWRFQGA